MIIDDAFVEKYASRIMRFSFNKTNNYSLAEDLAQEIMLQLSIALTRNIEIQNIDAYVTTICKYTWSNFLKKNKKHWETSDIDNSYDISSGTDIELQVVDKILCEKIRKEVSYLCQIHRKIIVAFYYDNKTTKEISEELQINENTVRWHLSESRKELKKAMEKKNINLDFEPLTFNCGHDGYCNDNGMYGLNNDLLVQNIIYACYGEPVTLSEISRKLNVSAAYLEGRINTLVEMDYLRTVGNKYQTTFYIETPENIAKDAEFAFNNIGPLANRLFEAVDKRMDDIMNIHFMGSDYLHRSDIELLILNRLAMELTYEQLDFKLGKSFAARPKRADGSEHWVVMTLKGEIKSDDKIKEYMDFCPMNGYRIAESSLAVLIECDNYVTGLNNKHNSLTCELANNIVKVHRIILENKDPDEFDKILISDMVKEGYVNMIDGKPVLQILYLNKDETPVFDRILSEITGDLGKDFLTPYLESFTQNKKKAIPDYLTKEAKEYYSFDRFVGVKMFAWLLYTQKLEIPTGQRARNCCTMLAEIPEV